MPASRRRCEPRAARRTHDEGVSEVIGQILMFGILSMVLILSLFSFNIAKDSAQERVLGTTSESVAQRVATLVVDTALFAEQFQEESLRLESRLELPLTLEGRAYTIDLDAGRVTVNVPSAGRAGTAPLFSAGSAGIVLVCDQTSFEGASIIVRVQPDFDYDHDSPGTSDGVVNIDADSDGVPEALPDCGATEAEFYVYLEPDP